MPRWVRENALSLVMFGAFLVFLLLQSVFGWLTRNEELAQYGRAADSYWSYLTTGHFVEATFENWESEFLQMAAYVLLTAFLLQKGSPESHPFSEEGGRGGDPDDPDAPGAVQPDSPWPVRKGGWLLKLYSNSLSVTLFLFFALSFLAHLLGGTADHNEQQALESGAPPISAWQFLRTSDFWFQSMQNWQSEFLAVGTLIVLSIFLRQRHSSQSKHVADPHSKTGS
jgi:hypothetical protein